MLDVIYLQLSQIYVVVEDVVTLLCDCDVRTNVMDIYLNLY